MKINRIFIIAEAGVNHNGSLSLAKKLIDAAVRAGADAVKFQSFKTDHVVTRAAGKAAYQNKNDRTTRTQEELLRPLELSEAFHRSLKAHCALRGIEFMSTPFDKPSLDLLLKLGLRRMKVPSGEITNAPFLLTIARARLPIILSTGMSTLEEVKAALGVLALGLTDRSKKNPAAKDFKKALRSTTGQAAVKKFVTLLQCTTEYPAPFSDVNLLAMDTMREKLGLRLGLSDHTPGIAVPIAAAARGAVVIEKHLTLDRSMPGPDHKASLNPAEFRDMVRGVREAVAALGSSVKKPAASELKNLPMARRSLVASRFIRRGERFSEDNLTSKRPAKGLSPFLFWDIAGKTASRDLQPDHSITKKDWAQR